jgi:hypothetical protein
VAIVGVSEPNCVFCALVSPISDLVCPDCILSIALVCCLEQFLASLDRYKLQKTHLSPGLARKYKVVFLRNNSFSSKNGQKLIYVTNSTHAIQLGLLPLKSGSENADAHHYSTIRKACLNRSFPT